MWLCSVPKSFIIETPIWAVFYRSNWDWGRERGEKRFQKELGETVGIWDWAARVHNRRARKEILVFSATGLQNISPSSLMIIIGKCHCKCKWSPLFILLLSRQSMDMFHGFPEDTSLLTPTTGLTDSRLRFHPQFPFQSTFSLWAPSVRQLFCHLSLPEPLWFSVWVTMTTPPIRLCCYP